MVSFIRQAAPPILLMCFLLLGCTTTPTPLTIDSVQKLSPEEGLLFIAVDTSQPLNYIRLVGASSIKLDDASLQTGTNYILIKAPAGSYRLRNVSLGPYYYTFADDHHPRLWEVRVEPGVINYIGNLEVVSRYRRTSIEIINKSSFALEFLEAEFPILLAGHDIVYSGPGEDDFFELVRSNVSKGVR